MVPAFALLTARSAQANMPGRLAAGSTLNSPGLVSPADSSTINSASTDTLRWSAVTGSAWYVLQVSVLQNFSNKDSIIIDTSVTSAAFSLSALQPRIYFWRVLAADSTDSSAWSSVRVFDFGPPLQPLIVSPQSGASDRPSPVTLRWATTFSDSSRVQLAVYRGDFAFSAADMVADTIVAADSLTVGGLSLGQSYYWRVSGRNVNGQGPWSTTVTFNTSAPPSVSLLQPGYGAQLRPDSVYCAWLPVGGALKYELQISTDQYYNSTPVVDTVLARTSAVVSQLSYGTDYYWRVRAQSNVGSYWGTWSSSTFFTFPAAPVLIFPADSGSDYAVRPVFRWKSVAGAAYYQIQVAYDSTFNSVFLDSTTSSAITDSLSIDSITADTTFFWHVRGGSNTNGLGNFSAVRRFTTASLPPAPPSMIAPADSSTILPLDVVFSWSGVAGADRYLFELSTDSTFRSIQIADSSVMADSILVDSLNMHTTYFWRLKSGSNSAGWGVFSEPERFFTTSYILNAPAQSTPSNGSGNLPTTVTLHWAAVPHAAVYQVQVSPDSALDTLIVNDTLVVGDSLSVTRLIRSFKYYWRVRAGLGGKSWGLYSPLWKFTVENWSQADSLVVDTTLNYPQYTNVSQFKPTDYRLFGLPGQTDASLAGMLKGTPGKDWQAFWDNGDTSNYLVKYDGSSSFRFGRGNAFWLIHNGPLKMDTTIHAAAVDSIGQVRLSLHPGWNIITDPFLINVPWDTVKALNKKIADPIWAYKGSFNTATSLVPFQGYYFFNADSLKSIVVPYIEPSAGSRVTKGLMTVASIDSAWTVRVTLQSGGIVDSSAWFGVSSSAKPGLNRLDVRKPAGIGFEPSVSFHHADWDRYFSDFASEIHPVFADSSRWSLNVEAVPGERAALSFAGLDRLPASFSAYLHDPVSGSWIDISRAGTFAFNPVSTTSNITVLVGKTSELSQLATTSRPLSFELENNYPNPFNPTTVIGYQIPRQSHVTLEVYNVLGQRVATLVNGEQSPGAHVVTFNGARFASGVYFYRIIAGNQISTKKMVLLK